MSMNSSENMENFQNSSAWLDAIVKSSDDAIIGKNLQGIIVSWNDSAKEMYGYKAEEAIGKSVSILLPADRKNEMENLLRKIQNGERIKNYETTRLHKDRSIIDISLTISPIKDVEGVIIGASTIARDITYTKKLQNELVKKNEELEKSYPRLKLAEQIFENANDGILVTDAEGVIQMVNPAFTSIIGYDVTEVIGLTPRIWKSECHEEAFYNDLWESLKKDGYWSGEIWNKKKTGEVNPAWVSINSICDDLGKTIMYSAIYRDLTERLKYEQELQHQAFHDALTGLPNRILFHQNLEQMIAISKRHNKMLAVFFLDLDGFKRINDTLGHDTGDLLLQTVAARLTAALRATDTVARMGGDEFTIILAGFSRPEDVALMADKAIVAIRQPYILGEHSITITTSVGISLYPQNGQDVQTLMKQADVAMYNAKNSGKNKYCFYDPAQNK